MDTKIVVIQQKRTLFHILFTAKKEKIFMWIIFLKITSKYSIVEGTKVSGWDKKIRAAVPS